MNQLIWKAWREQRIYFFPLLGLILSVTVFLFSIAPTYHAHTIVISARDLAEAWVFYTTVGAIVLAMTVACGERQSGALWFSVSLPVSIRRYAAVRLVVGLVVLLTPILIVSCLIAIGLDLELIQFEMQNHRGNVFTYSFITSSTAIGQLARVTAIAMVSTAQLYLLLCMAGCWLRTPAKVALFGAILAVALLVMIGLPGERGMSPNEVAAFGIFFPQSLSFQLHAISLSVGVPLALASAWLAGVGYLFTRFYGREPEPVERIRGRWWLLAIPPFFSRQTVPLRSRFLAMLWLELRQAGPLVLCGLILSAMLAIYFMLPGEELSEWGTNFQSALSTTTFLFALVWATVVGTSLYSSDLSDSLGGFWRSRPISPRVWFWCKYVVGLVTLLIVIDGTTLLVSWNPPQEGTIPGSGTGWAYLACVPLLHTIMYTAAVLGSCGLRRSGLGGVVAMAGFIVANLAIQLSLTIRHLSPFNVFDELSKAEIAGQLDLTQHHYPLVYGTIALAIVLMAFAASRLAAPLEPSEQRFWRAGFWKSGPVNQSPATQSHASAAP